jgi:CRISPR/Cas system CMR-associated protein Cmr1 (group 7 of RAMP superfamily)
MRWKLLDKVPEPPGDIQVVEPAAHDRKKEVIINNIRLTTPMLGGGVESLKIDHGMLIRAASIRGHLRFWWRTFQDCADVN